MAVKYIIWIVSPPGYGHSRCFDEAAQSLNAAFLELGHECCITKSMPLNRGRVIILGAHLAHPDDMLYLDNPVIWQLEQVHSPIADVYLETLKRAEVWDYSGVNQVALEKMGIKAKLCEIGYMPCLTKIENLANPDIDVLYYGSLNQRRSDILQALADKGVKVRHAFNEYGIGRDALIARSKIVLNIHYYPAKIFEIVRCSYLMANRKTIVSETGLDLQLERKYADGIHFDGYDNLVASTLGYLGDSEKLHALGDSGHGIFKNHSQAEFLWKVLQ